MKLDDAGQVANIHTEAWKEAFRGILDQALLDSLDVKEREKMWRETLIPNPERTNLVLEIGGHILAWSAFASSCDDSGSQELIGIYVDPKHFREGLGSELLNSTLSKMKTERTSCISLWVLKENAQAIGFYEKNGFKPSGLTRSVEWLNDALEAQYTMEI